MTVDTDEFIVFEEYQLPDGLEDHTAGSAFQALAGGDVIENLVIK